MVVYQDLGCDDIMYKSQVVSSKHLNLLYDDVERHYHVITNLTGGNGEKYVYNACHKSCRRDITHVCDPTCSDCMASPPCAFSDATNVTYMLEFGHISETISRVWQRENPFVNVKDVLRRVVCS